MNQEIEIKIQIPKEEILRIEKAIGCENEEWLFERTYGFFTPDGESVKKGIFPRIKTSDCTSGEVCIKVKEPSKTESDYFERREYEICTASVEKWIEILKALGYTKIRVFEKFRKQRIIDRNVKVCIDRLPFGVYIEIEGEKKEIEKTIKKLKLDKFSRIASAYLRIADDLGLENSTF